MFIKRCRQAVAPLHRRIFVWFGMAIFAAGGVGFAVSFLVGGGNLEWRRMWEGGRRVVGNRFAEVWDDPGRRSALASEVAREMNLDVTVRDTDGSVLDIAGEEICDRREFSLEPARDGRVLGRVDICMNHPAHRPISGLLGFSAALGVLWIVSHKVARRLGRPILDLVDVTDAIGRGEYDIDIKLRRHAPSEIVHLNGAIREMAAKIKKQLADQRELLASVSHELRSPLARLRLLLELLRDETLKDERRLTLLCELENEIVEMDDLVGGLLAQSRLEFSALSLRPNDLVASVARCTTRASLSIEPVVTGTPRSVRFDATLIARALSNLFDNAEKHGQGATDLTISFADNRVSVEVHDRGPGLTGSEAERIFDPFYGRPSAAHETPGLGLGLSLVQRIARAHGGDAYAKEREGGGATVGFWLPCAADRPG